MTGKPERRVARGQKTPSELEAYNEGVSDAIQNVIDEVDFHAKQRVEGGLSKLKFSLGVLNSFFIIGMFGIYPEHFWLVYLVELTYCIPAKFIEMTRHKPSHAFFYFDFCWVMNFIGIVGFLIIMFARDHIKDSFYEHLFTASFGIACGPIQGAAIVLPFVSLVFHELSSMTAVFIHVLPSMLFFTLRWKTEDVLREWPNTFRLDYDVNFFPHGDVPFTRSILGTSFILYTCWFGFYVIWQLVHGLKLPLKGKYDTVYHETMRGGLCLAMGNVLWKRPKEVSLEQMKTNEFELRDFAVYMLCHAFASFISFFALAYPCSVSRFSHGSILCIAGLICTLRGAKRYTYYATKMYSRLIRKEFASEIKEESVEDNNEHA